MFSTLALPVLEDKACSQQMTGRVTKTSTIIISLPKRLSNPLTCLLCGVYRLMLRFEGWSDFPRSFVILFELSVEFLAKLVTAFVETFEGLEIKDFVCCSRVRCEDLLGA